MENDFKEGYYTISIRELIVALRRNIILFLAIIIFMMATGFVYLNVQKPSYTAKQAVFFKAESRKDNNTINNINIMQAYIDTVIDFCDEGVVVDRASYYYNKFLSEKNTNPEYKVASFIETMQNLDTYYQETMGGKQVDFGDNNYDVGKISTTTHSSDSSTGQKAFSFSVCYTAGTQIEAVNRAKLLVFALKQECSAKNENDASVYKYFNSIEVEIIDQGLEGLSTNISKVKTMALFFLLGVVIAFLVTFAKSTFDNTFKSKQQLEQFTGMDVLTIIEEQGGKD